MDEFRTEDTKDREKDSEIIPGRPKHADLIQSMSAITEAGLRALWRSPAEKFPPDVGPANWEIWLDPATADAFIEQALAYNVAVGADRLIFLEDIVVIGHATRNALAAAVRRLGGVRAMAAPTITADFFDGQPVDEQAQWVDELLQRTTYPEHPDPGYLALLDTGVSRAHPLINPVLNSTLYIMRGSKARIAVV